MASSSKKTGISLSINKHNPVPSKEVSSVFGNDDSEEDEAQTPAQRFDSKFANLKAKDERAVKKVLEENPDIYDYDGAYDNLPNNKKVKVEDEEDSKTGVKRDSRYIGHFMNAKKKRDFEKLLRDERKQEKERATEGDEFKDKETFITSAYRKQLEETVKFRKELEETDRVDELTNVRGQKLWAANFGKKLLDDQIKSRYGVDDDDRFIGPSAPPIKEEDRSTGSSQSDNESEAPVKSDDKPPPQTSKHDDQPMDVDSASPKTKSTKESSQAKSSRKEEDRKPARKSFREEEREEQKRRMETIRKILARRNSDQQIEAARHRYFERRNAGLIVPPA